MSSPTLNSAALLATPHHAVRRVAAELTATRPKLSGLTDLLADEDPTVVEVTAWAMGEWANNGAGSVDELAEVATEHDDSLYRESAVAALGAIGDEAGLATVLAALDGGANVRRRAAIALAAFDTAEPQAGLQTCLTDRNWQVRQVAEDLLDQRTGN